MPLGPPADPTTSLRRLRETTGAEARARAAGVRGRGAAADRNAQGTREHAVPGPVLLLRALPVSAKALTGTGRAWTVMALRRSTWAVVAPTGSGGRELGYRKPGGGRSSPLGFSWVTVSGRPRQPDGPCSVEAETARLVRGRTGISAKGCVLVLERTADGVGPDRGRVEEQAGHPRCRSCRPVGGVPVPGPRARSRRECLRRW
jgi:hypothetical protein